MKMKHEYIKNIKNEINIKQFMKDEKPILKHELDIENQEIESYSVFEMPTKFFTFNKHNGRFRASASNKYAGTEKMKEISQVEIADYLKRVGKIDATKKDIEQRGQFIPIVATKDGVIIDGNRRFLSICELKQSTIKVIILKKDYKYIEELESLETRIQFSMQTKRNYDPLNRSLKIYQIFETMQGEENSRKEVVDYIVKITGESSATVNKQIEKWRYLEDLMELFGDKIVYVWFDKVEDQIFRAIAFEKKTFKSKSNEVKNKWYWNNTLALKEFRKTIFAYIFMKVRSVGGVRELLSTNFREETLVYNEEVFKSWTKKTNEIFIYERKEEYTTAEESARIRQELTKLMEETISNMKGMKKTTTAYKKNNLVDNFAGVVTETKENKKISKSSDEQIIRYTLPKQKTTIIKEETRNKEQIQSIIENGRNTSKKIKSDPFRIQIIITMENISESLIKGGELSEEEKNKLSKLINKLRSKL